jgi:hypothetical protein
LEFARAVRTNLATDAEVTLWNEGVFALGSTFIESLVTALPRFDFAVLVLTGDDLLRSRQSESLSPRDNVLFELGLFTGRLGRARTFIAHQREPSPRIPSDLAGVTTATYDWPRQDGNHVAALGPACDSIRQVIRQLGVSETRSAQAISALTSAQNRQQEELTRHSAQIRFLQVALQGIVTQFEFDKLIGLNGSAPFLCYYSDDLYAEMKRLRAMGLVHHFEGTGLGAIRRDFKDRDAQFDLKRFFYITSAGQEYVALRRELADAVSD